jgi:hypothetical protein
VFNSTATLVGIDNLSSDPIAIFDAEWACIERGQRVALQRGCPALFRHFARIARDAPESQDTD